MRELKVLIAHKEEEVVKEIECMLGHFNLEFILVNNGLDALAAAKYESPDLIIANIELDVLMGTAMANMLNADPDTKSIPTVFLHTTLDHDLIAKATKLGAKGFLTVPYQDNTLIYTVKRALPEITAGHSAGHQRKINHYSVTNYLSARAS